MLGIRETAYLDAQNLQSNDKRLVRKSAVQETAKKETDKAQAAETGAKKDRVTLSPGVGQARLKESLGLNPVGRLGRNDIEEVIKADEQTVMDGVTNSLGDLTVEEDENFTLSLNGKGKIQVKGSFSGKKDLEKSLNSDEDFVKAFKRLSTNSEILSFADSTVMESGSRASLADYLNSEESGASLDLIASQYEMIKKASSPLSALVKMSEDSGNRYVWDYKDVQG